MKTATNTADIYTRVTNKIIADLEQGTRPWFKPWSASNTTDRITLPLRHNGVPYRGINILLLWGEAMAKGYSSSRWMTFKQASELGANVRKGEHGSLVVYANTITKTESDDNGQEIEREIPFMKGYTVFNVEQIEGLPDSYQIKPEPKGETLQLIEQAEAFFAASGATFRHGGNRAYYAPALDLIQLPPAEAFRDAESYASTKAHELTHWTSHPSRLNRILGKRFGDEAYAAEELIAELGAAFLSVDLGITPEPREDHAAYLAHWLKVLREDRKAIFTAAAHAQRAVDFLHTLQGEKAIAA
ncbi:ArdC family protein [Candidatus Nitrotoga sp. AM1P]|uniref:ArdC family protein n=1 Tax=Candidatus Nitrotoga sp. AM1P TaxID=2559597 RepID=UPI0010B5EB00|nr:zincin-like metallopeptidase domain-containing protein [Candidatus Nitrotoga sp. AM1P]BBJ23056.1 antirestriction protein [Candidatus Nitrotoga sp. AM1P]